MAQLLRTRTVLPLRYEDQSMARYGKEDDEGSPGRILVGHGTYRTLIIDQATREALGHPEVVTVTIEPGDLMNATPDASLEVYRRSDGRYDWRLTHRNGNILCGSDQGYENRTEAVRIADAVLGIRGGYGIGYTDDTDGTGSLVRDPQAN